MSRTIIPVPASTPVLVDDLVAGDWISDSHVGPWHYLLDVNIEAGSITVGDTDAEATTVPVGPGQMALRLNPEHAPRTWHAVQTTETETDNKINGGQPGPQDRSL